MSDLITGEAVALEMRLAKLPSRAVAIVIDLIILFAGAVVLFSAAGAVLPALDPAMAAALSLATGVALVVGVPVLIESLSHGRSVGKLVMGLRVVRDDGGPVRFRHALVRALAGVFVDFYVTSGAGAVVSSLLNERGKRVGDLLAGTVVIRERAPARSAPLPAVPPPLTEWATSLQLSRLPDDLALAARRYLARYHELSPQARDAMGARYAGEVARYVTPPAPPGTPAWAYLAAVLSERRRRESERLAARSGPSHDPADRPFSRQPRTAAAGDPLRDAPADGGPMAPPA